MGIAMLIIARSCSRPYYPKSTRFEIYDCALFPKTQEAQFRSGLFLKILTPLTRKRDRKFRRQGHHLHVQRLFMPEVSSNRLSWQVRSLRFRRLPSGFSAHRQRAVEE